MLTIGLTGSLAMGKTTIARLFMDEGIPVHDSDACVHALYEREAVEPIGGIDPAFVNDGMVNRAVLAKYVSRDPKLLQKIEEIVHPLVEKKRTEFLKKAKSAGLSMAVLDVPLLFETGLSKKVDLILVVTTDEHMQKTRALKRPGMTAEKLAFLLSKQMPNSEKVKLAHWVIDTSFGLERAKADVRSLIKAFTI